MQSTYLNIQEIFKKQNIIFNVQNINLKKYSKTCKIRRANKGRRSA